MKNSLRIHKWTHNEFNIFILGVLTRPLCDFFKNQGVLTHPPLFFVVFGGVFCLMAGCL